MIAYQPVCEGDPVALAIAALPAWLLSDPWLHVQVRVDLRPDTMAKSLAKTLPMVLEMPTKFATQVGRAALEWPDCLGPMAGAPRAALHPLVLAPPAPFDVDALWPMGPTQAGWCPTAPTPPRPVRERSLRSCTERRRLVLVAFDTAHPELVGVDCHAGRDGECNWATCPQNLEGEPQATGRHCPLDRYDDEY